MKRSELYDVIAGLDEKLQEDANELKNQPDKSFFRRKRVGVIAVSFAVLFVTAVVLLTVFVVKNNNRLNGAEQSGQKTGNSGEDNSVLVLPTDDPAGDPVNSRATFKFRKLSYDGVEDMLVTFNADNFGAALISAKAKGIHENCSGVYYDQFTGEVICFEHEFLEASGIVLPEGHYLEFYVDRACDKLVAVKIRDNFGNRTDLWVMNRTTCEAARVMLPEGCPDYGAISIGYRSLYNGILCVNVNCEQGDHYILMYNVNTREVLDIFESDGASFISGGFLSGDIMEIYEDGKFYFFNVQTGLKAEIAGDYNYCYGGIVYSVKNWGGAFHTDVAVAAYDADTGKALDNVNVLVQTFVETGKTAVLLKNTTSGEETVLLEDVNDTCCGWSDDYSCFYAYSEKSGKLIRYNMGTQVLDTAVIESVDKGPVVIDGRTYAVYVNYSLAIGQRPEDVTVYYTRNLRETTLAPEYGEKVDSPYWETYCDIKFRNFADENSFEYASKNGIYDGWICGKQIFDMLLLRDVILECLESKGDVYNGGDAGNDEYVMVGHLICGSLRIIFYECGDQLCIAMPRNVSPFEEYDSAAYEFPREVFQNIEEKLLNNNAG